MSLMRPLLAFGLRAVEKRHLSRVAGPEEVRASFARKTRIFFGPSRQVTVTPCDLGGVSALEVDLLRAAREGASDGPVVLYVHGGGFVFGSARTHAGIAAEIARRTGYPVYLPDYRLAPEHPFPAALEDLRAAWEAVAAEGRPVFIGGDSAGGGLVLALLAELAEQGAAMPSQSFVFSPVTDLRFTALSIRTNARSEQVLPAARSDELAQLYLDGADPSNPRISPRFAVFPGVTPVHFFVAETEIMRDDTLAAVAQMRALGGCVTLERAGDLPHAWPFFARYLPEARQTLDRLASRLRPAP